MGKIETDPYPLTHTHTPSLWLSHSSPFLCLSIFMLTPPYTSLRRGFVSLIEKGGFEVDPKMCPKDKPEMMIFETISEVGKKTF